MYQCIICQHANASTTDLHNHHIQNHTSEELSYAVIDLQGFQSLNDTKYEEKKCLKPVKLGDSNNNESICDRIVNNIFYDGMRNSNHDKGGCSINCSKYSAWERELYKGIKINDDEFFNVVECLCNDLRNRKKRGRKRKTDTMVSYASTSRFNKRCEDKIQIKREIETMEQKNDFSSQNSTMTLSYRSENSISDTNKNKEVHNKQTKSESRSEKGDTALTFIEIDTNDHYLTYDKTNNSFSWSSIITVDSDGNEISSSETNGSFIPQKLDQNFIKNLILS